MPSDESHRGVNYQPSGLSRGEEGGPFLFVENDDRQLQHHPQTSVKAADSQDTSANPAQ